MKRATLTTLACVAMAVGAACGGDDSTNGGAGATPDAGASDVAVAVDSSASDSALPQGDANVIVEAGGDGGRDFSTDRGKFFGASRCANAGVQLCEDFESGTLDTATWTVVGDMPVIDGVQKARGTKALHITKAGNGLSYIKEKKTFPAKNNTYWGRSFIWFSKLPGMPMTYAHWTFAAATGTGVPGEIRLSGQLQNGANKFGVGTDSGNDPTGTGDWTNSDDDPHGMAKPVPTGQWVCIEWLHKGDTNETRFFWDAVEHTSLYTFPAVPHGGNAGNMYILPQFTAVWIGWQEYQTSTEPFEMWVDEIAIDAARIGCVL